MSLTTDGQDEDGLRKALGLLVRQNVPHSELRHFDTAIYLGRTSRKWLKMTIPLILVLSCCDTACWQ